MMLLPVNLLNISGDEPFRELSFSDVMLFAGDFGGERIEAAHPQLISRWEAGQAHGPCIFRRLAHFLHLGLRSGMLTFRAALAPAIYFAQDALDQQSAYSCLERG